MSRPATQEQLERAVADVRRAAGALGVDLPRSYARRIAGEWLGREGELGVTRLGAGVVLHLQPGSPRTRPVVLGYADARGQWHRDGSRHLEQREPEQPPAVAEVGKPRGLGQ